MNFNADRYNSMQYRRCGTSGLKLPLISLGFWQSLGITGNEENCRNVMYYAFDRGITHFDLANNYGRPGGHSEEVVGKYVKEMPRDELIISTKAALGMWSGPYGQGASRKHMLASLDQSLKRLDLDYVDIFYCHGYDAGTPLEETLSALNQAVVSGKALYVGVSNFGPEQFRAAVDIVKSHDWAPILIHQAYYHMFSRGTEESLMAETSANGTGIIAFCPLAGGVITDRYLNGLPANSRTGLQGEEGRKWWEENERIGAWDRVRKLSAIAKRRGQTTTQLALAWTLRFGSDMPSALIGASSVEQIQENIGTLNNLDFSPEELQEIDAVITGAEYRQWW